MQERVGFMVDDAADLLSQLDAYLRDPDAPEQAIHGRVEPGRDLSAFTEDKHLVQAVEAWIQDKNLHRLLEYWVQGLAVDWRRLYPISTPLPMSLPFYPFEPRSHRLPSSVDSTTRREPSPTTKSETAQTAETKRLMLRPVWQAKPATAQPAEASPTTSNALGEVNREQA